MSIPIPSGMARGKVSWRIGHDRAGTTLPGASGKVWFEPTARAVSYASMTVLPEPVETPVVAGVMTPVDLQVNDPAVWSWRVRPMVGVEWPPFALDVAAAGVDVARVAVVEASVPTRLVTAATLSEWRAALDGKVDDDDARLTDARTPTAHQHAVADVDGLAARLAAVEYDSGRRLVSLENGWTCYQAILRRQGPAVSLYVRNMNGATATANTFLTVPTGFRDNAVNAAAQPAAGLSPYKTGGPPVTLISVYTGALQTPDRGTDLQVLRTWMTDDPPPTTPPGKPA